MPSRHPTPRIALFVPPSPKNIASYIANAYTMRTSSQMYDAVKMKMIIIIHVRCYHHHDDHHHLCTMQPSSFVYDAIIIICVDATNIICAPFQLFLCAEKITYQTCLLLAFTVAGLCGPFQVSVLPL